MFNDFAFRVLKVGKTVFIETQGPAGVIMDHPCVGMFFVANVKFRDELEKSVEWRRFFATAPARFNVKSWAVYHCENRRACKFGGCQYLVEHGWLVHASVRVLFAFRQA
jgi:hypothetical protein